MLIRVKTNSDWMDAIFEVSWGRANLCEEKSIQFATKDKILIKKELHKNIPVE